MKIEFYEFGGVDERLLKYAVIVASYRGKWIFVRHGERNTWEIPGGRREPDENITDTASRELREETGALKFQIKSVCVYSVEKDGCKSYGGLFYAQVEGLGKLPDMEIAEIRLSDTLPEKLTYPLIQPYLFAKAIGLESK